MRGEMRIDPMDLPALKAKYGAGWVLETVRAAGAPIEDDALHPDYEWHHSTDEATGELVLEWISFQP
jgi:hypothetical protein